MFGRHKRRHTNILFVIFRLLLSLIIFASLLVGILEAYKHFSGVNPIKLRPEAIVDIALFQKILGQSKNFIDSRRFGNDIGEAAKSSENKKTNPKVIFRFALFADSHSDHAYLKRALEQIKKNYADIKFIIGLGDYTEVGTLDELKKVKIELDNTGFRYFVIPGDHDLWDSRNKSLLPTANFSQVFGPPYQAFIHENFLFLTLYNSDNYLGLSDDQKNWLSNQLDSKKAFMGTFIFLHEPLFHPSSDHFMGRVEERIKIEAQSLTKQFAESGVRKVFAADTHFFSEYLEPKTNLVMVTIGAITSARNLQSPRFAIVYVYDDGSTGVEDVDVR